MLLLLAIVLQDTVTPALRPFVRVSAPTVALTNVRVIDGTGAPAKTGQTIVISRGNITAVGDAATTRPPADAQVLDLAGRTVMPGYVMVHEHMYYPSGGGTYPWHGWSFPRLYLAGGATTIRTGGNMQGYADINLKRNIEAGMLPGPDIDATAPYLNGPGLPIAQVKALRERRRCQADGRLLGRRGCDVVQGVHADLARGAGGGGHGRARAEAQGDRPPLLRDLPRSRRPRHRRSRARLPRQHRFRGEQAT